MKSNKILSIFKQLEDAIIVSKESSTLPILMKIASCYHSIGDSLSSIECSTIAIEYYKKERDTKIKAYQKNPTDKLLMSIADTNHDIGHGYYMLKEYDKAIWYNQKALLIMDKVSEITDTNAAAANIATIHYDIGKLYFLTKNFDKAIESFNEALLHKQFVLAHASLSQQSISLDISRICKALGNSYHNKGDYNTAKGFFIKSQHYKLPITDQQADEIKEQEVDQQPEAVLWQRIIGELDEIGLGGDASEYAA